MVRKNRPRTGSLMYYPRVRAKRQTPSFTTVGPAKTTAGEAKPLNFIAYKAGMTHVLAINSHPKSHLYNQEEFVPATVFEIPPIRVFGVRVYGKGERYGIVPLAEAWAEKLDKDLSRKIANAGAKPKEKKGAAKKAKASSRTTMADLEKIKDRATEVRLLCHTVPRETGGDKKTPDVFEVHLNGPVEGQLVFAKEKLGQSIAFSDVFSEKELVDVRAISTGKGMQGVVKRHHVKSIHRKAKKIRAVGSIGPWHPNTVMWTVARPGQMGYNTRTEYNKSILLIGNDPGQINPAGGFPHYGRVQGTYLLLAGSVPGPVKRAVGIRAAVRPDASLKTRYGAIRAVGTHVQKNAGGDDGIKTVKVKAEEEKKEQRKSVDDEIRAAVAGAKS